MSPGLIDQIGRIREVEFREAGGGTGQELDLDEDDVGPEGLHQLFVWDPFHRELVAFYRYWPGWLPRTRLLPTQRLFLWSQEFTRDIWPHTMELGRSVVNRRAHRRLAGLFAVWAGLGALASMNPDLRYFWGKVTVFPSMPADARARLHRLLALLYPGPPHWIQPHAPLAPEREEWEDEGLSALPTDRRAFLQKAVEAAGGTIPSLLHSYLGLCDAPWTFGTAFHAQFGGVYETGLMVPVDQIHPQKRRQFMDSVGTPGSRS